jgi:hypothetical protein
MGMGGGKNLIGNSFICEVCSKKLELEKFRTVL